MPWTRSRRPTAASTLRWWGPLVSYMAFIFWMSSRARPGIFVSTPDYLLHGGGYFLLGVLAIRALAEGLASPRSASVIAIGVVITVLYGASDEWHQSFVPGRDASLRDLAADSVGALTAAAAVSVLWKKLKMEKSSVQ